MEYDVIYNCDCLEGLKKLPDKCVDLVVTDPPYEIDMGGGGCFGWKTNSFRRKYEPFSYGFDFDILKERKRVLKKMNFYVWCNTKQVRKYLDYFEDNGCLTQILVWCKKNCYPACANTYIPEVEYCIFAHEPGTGPNGSAATKHRYWVSNTNVSDKKIYGHPTIKPLHIIKNLIINSTNEGDVVLDPFIGSGTTAVAAKMLKRKYIGYEINQTYYETALKRINEPEQFTLF